MKFHHALALLALAGVAGCGSDPRLKRDHAGDFAFAPVRNDTNAEALAGPPEIAPGVKPPARGFIVVQSSFGYTTTYVFDAASGLFTGVWDDPAAPSSNAPPPEIHSFQLPKDERNAFVRMINMAWGPRRPAPGPASSHEVTAIAWLVDGADYKALDGYRAGQVIDASVVAVADKHKVVRSDYGTSVSQGGAVPAAPVKRRNKP